MKKIILSIILILPITTFAAVNVRDAANGNLLGSQSTGSKGTVSGGGQEAGGSYWWNVDFTSGIDGWVFEQGLALFTAPSTSPQGVNGPVGPDTTTNQTVSANPYGAPDYFVACTNGSDTNNGTSINTPWASLAKLSDIQYSMSAGTRVFFQRGCTFRGQITTGSSGTQAAPVTYDAYGPGNAPVISGTTPVTTAWTQHSGSIWKTTVGTGVNVKYLFVGSDIQTLAKTPNTGWLYTDGITGTSITDSWIGTQTAGSLNGSEVVLRSSPWSYHKKTVFGQSGSNISFETTNNSYAPNWNPVGWGYALQSKLAFLDQAGEWYYDSSSGILYLWAPSNANPNTLSVGMSTITKGLEGAVRSDIKVKNLVFEGYTSYAIEYGNGKRINLENIEVRSSQNGVNMYSDFNQSTTLANSLKNSYIHDIYDQAMYIHGGNGHLIEGNLFKNIGMDVMRGANSGGWGMIGIRSSVQRDDSQPGWPFLNWSNFTFRRNKIENVGYMGLIVEGKNALIEENVIKNTVALLDDGGGTGPNNTDGVIFRRNIVTDTIGNQTTMPAVLYTGYEGSAKTFYFGDRTVKNTIVDGNTFIGGTEGIWMDHAGDFSGNQVINNTIYGFKYGGLGASDYSVSFSCPWYQACYNDQYNDVVTGNKVYATKTGSFPVYQLYVQNDGSGGHTDYGTQNNNYFYKPLTSYVAYILNIPAGYQSSNLNLTQWRQLLGKDATSTTSNYTLASESLVAPIYYNETPNAMTVNIGTGKCTHAGVALPSSYSLPAFTSIVPEPCNLQ